MKISILNFLSFIFLFSCVAPKTVELVNGKRITEKQYQKLLKKAFDNSFGKMTTSEKSLFDGVNVYVDTISEYEERKFDSLIFENSTNDSSIIREPDRRKDSANVFWKRKYTLFDLITDEPIFPIIENGEKIYKIYYSSIEDPNLYKGLFTEVELENHLFYKFKNKSSCIEFCRRTGNTHIQNDFR